MIAILMVSGATASAAIRSTTTDMSKIGNDISWPQCGKTLPKGQAYGIVGVNGGKATTTNPCLADQLKWANGSTNTNPKQPKIQLYVNTANPGEVLQQYAVTSWPTNNVDSRNNNSLNNPTALFKNPYGACTTTTGNYNGYTNDMACSWQYGWNRAVESVDIRFVPAAQAQSLSTRAADYKWWLDVETENSWQTAGTAEAYARNTATIEGMKQFYESEGVALVGLYSTGYQWGQIVGSTIETSTIGVGANLKGLESWLAGASNQTDAKNRCLTMKGLTGGPVVLNQYISRALDYNYSCI